MGFREENFLERMKFVDLWSKYVLAHDDKIWSRQQNKIINSCLRSSKMTKNQFLSMKGELMPKKKKLAFSKFEKAPHEKTMKMFK